MARLTNRILEETSESDKRNRKRGVEEFIL